ncbi:hypothetical protein CHS0354_034640 [Potamilus streckersoni]|uniref:Uncharacterized protein n=1 Tax=Potamilus streckersoni TaxID=2493646 RepID=A0AAE0WBL1_9BIVA|nr:hypothetical protein CHS0354_034640 [Potamilus streckersoni]
MKNILKCLFWTGLFLSMDIMCECIIIKSIDAIGRHSLTTTDIRGVTNGVKTAGNTRFGAWGGKRSMKIALNKSVRFPDNPVWPAKRPFPLKTSLPDDYYTTKLSWYGQKSHYNALPLPNKQLNRHVQDINILKRAQSYRDGIPDESESNTTKLFAALGRALYNIVDNAHYLQRAVNMKDFADSFHSWGGK